MLRTFLVILVFVLPIALVAFAVLIGGYVLAAASEDALGASVLWWSAMVCLIVFVIDLVVMIGVLGVKALDARDWPKDDE